MNKQAIAQELVKIAKEMTRSPVTPQFISEINDLRKRNLHTEAALELANAVGSDSDVKILESILVIKGAIGSMPSEVGKLRDQLVTRLLAKVKKTATPEEYQSLYRSF